MTAFELPIPFKSEWVVLAEWEPSQRRLDVASKLQSISREGPRVRIHLPPAASLRTKVAKNMTVSAINARTRAQSLPKVKMPNRDGFVPSPRDPK